MNQTKILKKTNGEIMELKYFKQAEIDVYMVLKVLELELDTHHDHSSSLYDSLQTEIALEIIKFMLDPSLWIEKANEVHLWEKWQSILKFKSGNHYLIWLCYQLELKLNPKIIVKRKSKE